MPTTAIGHPVARWVTLAARLVLGGVLIVAGGLKLPWPEASVQAVRAYQLLPFDLTRPIGYALPAIEVVAGLLLVLGLFTRVAAWVGAALMVAFVIGIGWVWSQGISIDCGCFGGGGEVENGLAAYPWEIARDLGLLACGVWVALRPGSPFALDGWLFGTPDPTADTDAPINETEESRP